MNKFVTALFIIMSLTAHAQKITVPHKVKYLALGDSYTIGESVDVHARWPVQLADSLRRRGVDCPDPRIIARTGWRTDELKAAIEAGKVAHDYDLVSLLIGVNNQYQGGNAMAYKPMFEELLNMAISLAGGKKNNVFVVSIPDYGFTPFGQGNQANITAGIDAFNKANKEVCDKMGIVYFDITPISRKGLTTPDLVAGDGLHPSGKMYSEWVSVMLERITTEK